MSSPPPSSNPVSSTPEVPAATPDDAAVQQGAQAAQTADAQQTTSTRDLAASLDVPPPVFANILKGSVTAASLSASPPVISVQLSGDTSTTIDGVRMIDSYTPVVGDTCLIAKQGGDIFALGQMNDTGTGAANGWTAPTLNSGFTTSGYSNGNLEYRIVVDNGDDKIQWQGSVAAGSGVSNGAYIIAASGLPASATPSARRTFMAAANSNLGAGFVMLDFNTDGSVRAWIAVFPPATSTATAPGAGGAPSNNTTTDPGSTSTGSPSTNTTGASGTGTSGGASTSTTDNAADFFTDNDANVSGGSPPVAHWHKISLAGNPHNHGHAHTHSGPSHTHDMANHTHTVGGHTHGMQSHTHTGASHTHAVTPVFVDPAQITWVSFNGIEFFL